MDAPIYVPVVKAKRNDIASLGGVVPANRPAIRPLLELAEYSSSDCDQILGALVTRLAVAACIRNRSGSHSARFPAQINCN